MDIGENEPAASTPPKRTWRRHSEEFRARVIDMARQPNTSVAAVALANGLNANMLRQWVRDFEAAAKASDTAVLPRNTTVSTFVQLPMDTPSPAAPEMPEPAATGVDVEIRRNGTTLRTNLPLDSRSAAWLREVMG